MVVHDWGGMIGMLYASRHPERIKRIVILNTAAFHLPASTRLPLSLSLIRNTPLGPFLVRGLNAFSLGAVARCARRPLTADVRAGYLQPYDCWKNRLAVLRFVETIPIKPEDEGYDLVSQVEAGLEQFKSTPMMICWGMKDFVFDAHFLDEWVRHFPLAEVHRFIQAGHYVLEDASEEIIPLVKTFLHNHPLKVDER